MPIDIVGNSITVDTNFSLLFLPFLFCSVDIGFISVSKRVVYGPIPVRKFYFLLVM
jgi:hypothetical protein